MVVVFQAFSTSQERPIVSLTDDCELEGAKEESIPHVSSAHYLDGRCSLHPNHQLVF